MKIDFFKFYQILVLISLILVSVSIFFISKGLNYGTDFIGGIEITFSLHENKETSTSEITDLFLKSEPKINVQVEKIIAANQKQQRFILRSVFLENDEDNTRTEKLLETVLAKEYGESYFKEVTRTIGSVVSGENRSNAIWITLIVILMIVSYVGIRFQSISFGLATIIAVLHDVLLMLGIVAFMSIEMNILIVVAILTIFGYSVNDTIVLFDRVRENLQNTIKANFKIILNNSINQILIRSLITSLTTIVVVFFLYNNTTGSYRDFTFILMIGLVSGTYSSIYIATTFLLLANRIPFLNKKKEKKLK